MAYYNQRGYNSGREYYQARNMIDQLATERWRNSGENQPDYYAAEQTVRRWLGKKY